MAHSNHDANVAEIMMQEHYSMRSSILVGTGVFLAVLIAHLMVAHFFATDLPFWDPWDAEGWHLLRPLASGSLSWSDLLSPFNEHRLLFTRLAAILLFVWNDGQWDNLVTVTFNAILYALFLSAAIQVLARNLSWRTYAPLFASCVLLGCLPLAAWNYVSGFQSQFYFLIIFSVAGIWFAASRPPSLGWLAVLCLFTVCSMFTVASGALNGLCFAATALLKWRGQPAQNAKDAQFTAINGGFAITPPAPVILLAVAALALTAGALYTMPRVPQLSANLEARGLAEFCSAAIAVFSWPLNGRWWCTLLVWGPCIVGALQLGRRRTAGSSGVTGLVLGAWVIVQGCAMSYSRGHAIATGGIPSRYFDILSLGLLVNIYFALRFCADARHRTWGLALAGLLAIYAGAIGVQTADGFAELKENGALARIQIEHVRRFVATGDIGELEDKPYRHIPYGDPSQLGMMLTDPVVRHMLPVSVRASLSLPRDSGFVPDGFPSAVSGAHFASVLGSYDPKTRSPNDAELHSSEFSTHFSYIALDVAGYVGASGLSLTLQPQNAPMRTIQPQSLAREGWVRLYLPAPREGFQLNAVAQRKDYWFAFTELVEMGTLSVFTARLLDGIVFIAAAFLVALVFPLVLSWHSALRRESAAAL